MDDDPSTRHSRRAVLGLTAGTLAGVSGCIGLADQSDDQPANPTDSPTDRSTPSPTGTGPDESPTPVDPAAVTLRGVSVQSSALGRHVTGGFLDLRTSDGWLVYVRLGTEDGHTPGGNSVAHQRTEGYPEQGSLRLSVRAAGQETTYEESRRRTYRLVGDAGGAWTAFELPGSIEPDHATVEWPAQDRTLGELPASALDRLGREPPAFVLESFVAGEPGTTPGPTPHGSPTPDHDDFPTTTVDFELTVQNDGGPGTVRGLLDHETPKEKFTADYSQGGRRIAAAVDAGERHTLTGDYTVYHYEDQPTVEVRAETAGGSATSHVATGE